MIDWLINRLKYMTGLAFPALSVSTVTSCDELIDWLLVYLAGTVLHCLARETMT